VRIIRGFLECYVLSFEGGRLGLKVIRRNFLGNDGTISLKS